MTVMFDVLPVLKSRASRTLRRSYELTIQNLGGLSHSSGTRAIEVATELSKLLVVERVVVTMIQETNVGTWRKGSRS